AAPARCPALLIELLGFEDLLDHPDLVVNVENGEVALQPDHLGVPAQDLHANTMEGADPGHAFHDLPHHLADALLHFACCLIGKGDSEDLARMRPGQITYARHVRC